MSLTQTLSWDIFCAVIDNYGDIGVTWRLARQLTGEHGQQVRLWVDDLAAFHRIQPAIDPQRDCQNLAGVEVRRWCTPLPDIKPANVVIEALACNLPEQFVARMAEASIKPLWINLEYLSAEDWVEGVHGLPSPHPPLQKYFFMPGFNARTGGLPHESWLAPHRQAFQASRAQQTGFWANLGLPPAAHDETRISLFCYENSALPSLLHGMCEGPGRLSLLVPMGKAVAEIARWTGRAELRDGDQLEIGQLTIRILPMLELDQYDQLLWACDLNFVRGEDSFLRAQFAAKPMVWQAYPQDEDAHLAKLEAFLNLYCAAMPAPQAERTRTLFRRWNRRETTAAPWPQLCIDLPNLSRHAVDWSANLLATPDLASNLLIFCKKKLES